MIPISAFHAYRIKHEIKIQSGMDNLDSRRAPTPAMRFVCACGLEGRWHRAPLRPVKIGYRSTEDRVREEYQHHVDSMPRLDYQLTAETSELGAWIPNRMTPPREFTVNGHNGDVNFRLVGVDRSGEDVAGWRYEPIPGQASIEGKVIRLLIIND